MTRSRLDAPFGQWIDRSESVDIRFEGKTYSGFMGDTVASALIANQQWLLSRSFKYHRPRGPLTLCGHDANTLVQLPEAPNRLADELPISEHRVINAQNYSGSLERDRNQLLDSLGRFMPVGFYYKAFYKPFGSWRFWERIIRRKAGLGVANLTVEPRYTDKQYLFHDIAIIGGGPAGLSAALTAAQAGASVLLIDDQPHLGGSLNYHRFDIDAAERAPTLNHLRTQILDNDNIRVLTSATCNGWFTDHYLPVIQGDRLFKVRAKSCVLATGSSEQHVVFRNNDLPGVVLCSALERLINHYAVAPQGALVVLAGNDQAWMTALTAVEAGLSVAAVVDLRDAPDDADLRRRPSALRPEIDAIFRSRETERPARHQHHGPRRLAGDRPHDLEPQSWPPAEAWPDRDRAGRFRPPAPGAQMAGPGKRNHAAVRPFGRQPE